MAANAIKASVASKATPKGAKDAVIRQAARSVEWRPIDSLIPYARNARTHSAEQVAQIAASITEFGWTNPVLADATGIIAGHGRVMAARKLAEAGVPIKLPDGIALPIGTVPVIDCTGWSDAKRRAYILADNKLALNAGWDMQLLALELEELPDLGFSAELLGFSADDLARLQDDLSSAALSAAGDGSGAGDGDGAGGGGDPANFQMVSFVAPMTAHDRRYVLEVLAQVKDRFSLENTGECLMALARDYATRNPS